MINFASIRYGFYTSISMLIYFLISQSLSNAPDNNAGLFIMAIFAFIPGFITGMNWYDKFPEKLSEGDLWKLAFIFSMIKISLWLAYFIILTIAIPEIASGFILLSMSGIGALLLPVLFFYFLIILLINRFSFPLGFKIASQKTNH